VVPFWRGAAGLTFGLFGLVAALTFLAGVDHLVATPRLAGVNWDAVIWLPAEAPAAQVDETVARLREDRRVLAASAGTYFPPFSLPGEVTVGEARVQVSPMSFSTGPNAVSPTVIDGRAPEGPDEILLNPLLAKRVELSLGEEVHVRVATADGAVDTHAFELVGTGVLPVGDGRPEVGTAMTLDGLRRLAPEAPAQMILVDLHDNVSSDAVFNDLGIDPRQNEIGGFTGVEQVLGINVTRTRQAPIVLGVVLGIMAAGVLAHLSATAVRARTGDIAVVRALGFDSRQVRRAMGWMVTILSGVSLAVALPLGVLAGREAFSMYAESLGVPPEPTAPLWALAALLPALLLVAYLVSLWPSWRASRVATAAVLRTE
jgi:ABC-type lipoprotein release transport system permease subunit